LIYIFLNLPNI